MTDYRSDLAEEILKGSDLKLTENTVSGRYGIIRKDIEIETKKQSEILKKPIGKYITVFSEQSTDIDKQKYLVRVLARAIKDLIIGKIDNKLKYTVLAVGLGNRHITMESLGAEVADRMLVTRHMKDFSGKLNTLCAISTSVLGMTGIESAEIVLALSEKIKPDIIICVDSLATTEIKRLNSVFQLTDAGITPGSGTNSLNKTIDMHSAGVPVIAIGVPLISIAEGDKVITTRGIDKTVQDLAGVISKAITLCVHNSLTVDEVMSL